MKSNGISIDDAIVQVGGFGRFQFMIEVFFCILMLPGVMQILIVYFTAYNPGWQCTPGSTVCMLNGTISKSSPDYEKRCSMPRTEWGYFHEDKFVPKEFSVVTEFGLYCDKENLIYVITSLFFISWGIGAPILGWLQDRYGRVRLAFPCFLICMVVGLLSSFSPAFWVFVTARSILGFIASGTSTAMFIIISEMVSTKHRPLAGMTLWVFFTIALMLIGMQAYFIREWKILSIVCTAPYFFTIVFFKFIPESVRWLRLTGKEEKAMEVFTKIAKINRSDPPAFKLQPVDPDVAPSSGLLTLFRNKALCIRTVVQLFAWMVHGMVYYGLTLASDDLGGNIYRDYILSSLVEFPAVIIAIVGCNKIGRKKTVISTQILAAVACIGVALIPKEEGYKATLRVVIGMLGKLFITTAFDGIYTWSVEIFPTSVRSSGMGSLQVSSRIGAAMSPWVAKWLQSYGDYLPFVVMGASGLIMAIFLFVLPETKDRPTAETVEDDDNNPEKMLSAELGLDTDVMVT